MQKVPFLFITGPMFAGKTQKLIRMIKFLQKHHKQKRYLIFKPSIDQRFKSSLPKIISHNSQRITAFSIKQPGEILTRLAKATKKAPIDYLFITEINLFAPELALVFEQILAQNISLICDGLTFDYQKKLFPVIKTILNLNPKIETLSAKCFYCFAKATFSQRITDSKEIILVGAEDFYRPVCAKCHEQK